MSNRRLGVIVAGSAVAAGTVAAAMLEYKRWATAHDPTGGEPLFLPEGTDLVVRAADGAELATRVAGDPGGTTFVLSHCWTGDRRVWGPVARRLVERGHQVVLYDQRGHGGSTSGTDGLTLEALAGDVLAVLEQVDARGAVLAGHSMGGMAAQAFAIEHPKALHARVRALGLVATACDRAGVPRFATGISHWAVASPRIGRLLASQRMGPVLVRRSVGKRAVRSHLLAVRDTFAATEPETRATFLAAMGTMDFTDALAAVDLPAVVAVGTHDHLTPPRRGRRLAAALPNARLEVIPDAGHMLPSEAPDRIAQLLLELV